MKTKTLAILIATTSLAHATLIDLTPGGFNVVPPFPKVVSDFFGRFGELGMVQTAGANISNNQPVWSPFEPFGADRFSIVLNPSGTEADVTWNLTGTPFRQLFVYIETPLGIANLYGIHWRDRFEGQGEVTLNGTTPIGDIIFTGTKNGVPDSGSTLLLLGMSLTLLAAWNKPWNWLCRWWNRHD